MNVLLISVQTADTKGGIAVWTEHYLNSVVAQGIDCRLVNTATVGERSHNLTAKRSLKDEWVRTRRIMKDLTKALKSQSYDVAHLNSSIGVFGIIRDYLVAKKIAKKKIPLFVHFHCDVPFWVTNGVVKWYLKRLFKITERVFVLCENSRKYLQDAFGVDAHKVPNFIDEDLVVDQKTISDRIQRVFFVGRVSCLKGAKEIYELSKRFPDIDFLLAGEVAEDVAAWDRTDNLYLLGVLSHEEVLAHLDEADVFLFPSYTEGFSMALAESMARGVPSIATDVGANADMIETMGGIIVPVGDVDGMQRAFEAIAVADVRMQMSHWCLEKVRTQYVTSRVMELFCEEYGRKGKE